MFKPLERIFEKQPDTATRSVLNIGEDKYIFFFSGIDCLDVLSRGQSRGDCMYWLDPDGGSHSNTFLAYRDMTSYNGGWTMCYTTDEYAKPSR